MVDWQSESDLVDTSRHWLQWLQWQQIQRFRWLTDSQRVTWTAFAILAMFLFLSHVGHCRCPTAYTLVESFPKVRKLLFLQTKCVRAYQYSKYVRGQVHFLLHRSLKGGWSFRKQFRLGWKRRRPLEEGALLLIRRKVWFISIQLSGSSGKPLMRIDGDWG